MVRDYYRDVNRTCGHWISSLRKTVVSASSVGTELRTTIRRETWTWYGEKRWQVELLWSLYNLNDVGDLKHKLAPCTTAPTHLDSEFRDAEGEEPVGPRGGHQISDEGPDPTRICWAQTQPLLPLHLTTPTHTSPVASLTHTILERELYVHVTQSPMTAWTLSSVSLTPSCL